MLFFFFSFFWNPPFVIAFFTLVVFRRLPVRFTGHIDVTWMAGQVFLHGNNNSSSSIICGASNWRFLPAFDFRRLSFSEVEGQRVLSLAFSFPASFLCLPEIGWRSVLFRWTALEMQHLGRGLGFWIGLFGENGKGMARMVEGTQHITIGAFEFLIHGDMIYMNDYHTLFFF